MKPLDDYYTSLLSLYQNSYNDYVEASKNVREEIKKQKPENPMEYKAYPKLTDAAFNKKLTNKKEFYRNRYHEETGISFEQIATDKCSYGEFRLSPNQKMLKNFLSPLTPYNGLLLYHGVGVGKCHAKDTPIMMWDGSIKMVQDIKVDEQLMGDDGMPRKVISLARGQDDMFKIIPTQGSDPFTVNSEHILCLMDPITKDVTEVSVNQYISNQPQYANLKLYRVPIDSFAAHATQQVYTDPYNIGFNLDNSYLFSDRSLRLIILAGIIDRCRGPHDNSIMIPPLYIDRILFLIRSLGIGCYVIDGIIHMFGKQLNDVPCRTCKMFSDEDGLISDFIITNTGKGDYFGFVIDGNHRYLMKDFTVTHNTCTAISIAEQYLNEPDSKKILVILSSNIKDNFKKQIFDITRYDIETNETSLCTGTKYTDMVLDKEIIGKEALEKRVNKLIKDRYQFMGYKELVEATKKVMEYVKQHEKDPSKHEQRYKERIKDMFSDRLIIVDEAHNLRMSADSGNKQISNTLLNVLEIAENTKLLLLSATPMFNNAKEIVYMMRLLMTNDRREPITSKAIFDKSGELTSQGEKTLVKASRGYVSYMRGENPFTFPFRLYPSINKDTSIISKWPTRDVKGNKISKDSMIKYLELVGSDMSEHQKKIYNRIKQTIEISEDDEEDQNIDEEAANDLQNTLQLCNVTYPNPKEDADIKSYYGKKGFESCFDRGKEFKYRKDVLDKYGEFLSYDKVGLYAPKLKTILDYVISSEGIIFVYSQYYYSGIYPMAIALEHIGFKKYNSTRNLCKDMKTIDNKFATRKRQPTYIIISRDKDFSPNNDKEIADAKARANMNGEEIKVIIVSKVGTEGIDFKNIREIHVLEPWFNLNRTEQIVGRGVRTCSHMDLPIEKRNTTVYLHASKYDDKEESIDIQTYRVAEHKQIVISKVQQILKQNAFDCNLNKAALLYTKDKLGMKTKLHTSQGTVIKSYDIGDKDNSYICDFGKCDLQCFPDIAEVPETDDTTFDPMFIVDDIDLYKRYISRLFGNKIDMSYKDIYQSLVQHQKTTIEEDVLSYALEEMLSTKYRIKNARGDIGYLIYKGDTYIFQEISQHETKLSVEERQESRKRFRLDIDALKIQYKPKTPPKPTQDMQKAPVIVESISARYQELKTLVKKLPKCIVKDHHIKEFIVDRLSIDDISYLVNTQHKDDLISSIVSLIPNVFKAGDKVYIYDIKSDTVYTTQANGEAKITGPLELSKLTKDIKAIKTKLTNVSDDYVGLIDYSKKNDAQFKIRDNPKTKGYVCHQTSSLSVEELKLKIIAMGQLIPTDVKYVKKHLCDIYELVLRTSNSFKRPQSITKN